MTESEAFDSESGLLAAELALGLLDPEASRQAERRMASDRPFAAEVRRWQRIVDGWLEDLDDADSDPVLFDKIERRLDCEGSVGASADESPPTRWKTWAMTSMAATVALAALLALSLAIGRRTDAPAANFAGNVTQINTAEGATLLSAVYEKTSGRLVLRVTPINAADKAPELWVIPKGGMPHSLGLLTGGRLVIGVSPEVSRLLIDGSTIAITLEAPEGAPHAAPTGKILGSGKLQSI